MLCSCLTVVAAFAVQMALVSSPLFTMPGSPCAMNFTDNQHGPLLLYHLQRQRAMAAYCDVRLTVDGRHYGAHRCVLAAASEFFAQLFAAAASSSSSSPCARSHEQVTIRCGDGEAGSQADVFALVLEYIYTGSVVVDRHSVSELVRLANHLAVPKLKAHCAEYLARYLHADNCLAVLDTAGKYRLTELERAALVFASQNAEAVLSGRHALQLSAGDVERLLRDHRLQLTAERRLVYVLDWVCSGVSSREQEMRQLLLHVPLELVEAGVIRHLLHSHRLLVEYERCLLVMLQSLSDAGVHLHDTEQDTLRQLEVKFDQVNDLVDNDAFLSMAITTAIEELESTESAIFDGLHRLQQQADPSQMSSLSATDLSLTVDSARDLRCHIPSGSPTDPTSTPSHLGPISLVARSEPLVSDGRGTTIEFDTSAAAAAMYSLVDPPVTDTAFYDSSLMAATSITDQRHEYDTGALEYGVTPPMDDSLAQTIATSVPVDALHANLLAVAASDGSVSTSNQPSLGGVDFSCRYSNEDRVVGMASSASDALLVVDRVAKTTLNCTPFSSQPDPSVLLQSHLQSQCVTGQAEEIVDNSSQILPANLHYRPEVTQCSVEQPQWQYQIHPMTSHEQRMTSQHQQQHIFPDQSMYQQGEEQYMGGSHVPCGEDQFGDGRLQLLGRKAVLDSVSTVRAETFVPDQIVHDTGCRDNDVDQYGGGSFCGEIRHAGVADVDDETIARSGTLVGASLSEQLQTSTRAEQLQTQFESDQLTVEAVQEGERRDEQRQAVSEPQKTTTLQTDDEKITKQQQDGGDRGEVEEYRTGALPSTMPAKKRKLVSPVLAQLLAESTDGESTKTTSYKFKKHLSRISLHSEENSAAVTAEPISIDSGETTTTAAADSQPVAAPANSRAVRSRARQLYKCDVCATSVNTHRQYLTHMQSHFAGPPFVCVTCGGRSRTLAEFLRHRRRHEQNRPHQCDECGCSFWKRYDLVSHARVHSGERPYSCEQCGERFALLSTLRQHRLRHQSERKLRCDQCDFTTKYASHMGLHRKLHSGDLHRCSHANCDYTTPKRSHLREHLQSHAARRTYQCPECPRAYNVKTHLSRHMHVHRSSSLLRCPQCDYTAHRSDQFRNHMKRHEKQAAARNAQQRQSWQETTAPGHNQTQT